MEVSFLSMLFFVLRFSIVSTAQTTSIAGTWQVVKIISDDYNQPTLSSEEKNRDIGSKLTVNKSQMILKLKAFSDTCSAPNCKFTSINPNEYFRDDAGKKLPRMSKWLGYKTNRVTVVSCSCDSYWGKLIMLQNDLLIVRMEGYFYYFKSVANVKATSKPI